MIPPGKNALRSPVRHLRPNRQCPRPVRGRVRRARPEPACHAPQVRRLLQDLGAGYLPQRPQDQSRPRLQPVVTLAMAREKALANARAIAEGRDPRWRMQRVPTFEKANETVVAIHARHWKSGRTEGQWRASMRDYVLPRLARKRVDAVTTADVMAVLLPIWSTKRVTAGRRALGRGAQRPVGADRPGRGGVDDSGRALEVLEARRSSSTEPGSCSPGPPGGC